MQKIVEGYQRTKLGLDEARIVNEERKTDGRKNQAPRTSRFLLAMKNIYIYLLIMYRK